VKTPILGSSYVARSVNAADNRMVNLFPEIIPEGGKEPAFLQRTPGLVNTAYFAGGSVGVNALHTYTYNQVNYLVIVRGQQVYTSANGAAPVYRANISGSNTDNKITMAHNDTQVFIANRRENTGWVMNMASFAITQEAGPTFGPDTIGVGTVIYLDGYFVFNTPGTNRMYVSNLLDGTTIDPLAWASADASPDLLLTIATINNELWVFGSNSTEVWYNAGTEPFPFNPIQGSFTEVGIAAIASVATLDNSLFWLGKDNRGQGIVYRTNGYRPERVSTHAIEYAIQQYSDISDAIAYSYQQNGHGFYVITFPTGNATFVYDVATQAWHERASWDGADFNRSITTCQAFYDGETMVGATDGKLYELSLDTFTEDGDPMRFLRSWRALPTGANNFNRTAHHGLTLDAKSGNSVNDMVLTLRWSDDGGNTFSNGLTFTANSGTTPRFTFHRLGMTQKLRDRVYEISSESDCAFYLMGAELEISKTNA